MNRTSLFAVCGILFFATQIPTHAAHAVRVTSGALTFGDSAGQLNVEGTANLSMSAPLSAASGNYAPFNQCFFDFCPPGTDVSLHAFWSTPDLSGSVTLRGDDYVLGKEGEGGIVGHIQFDGHIVLPEYTADGTTDFSAPFVFEAALTPELPDVPGGGETEALTGHGTATLSLRMAADGSTWRIDAIVYAFEKRAPRTAQSLPQ